MPMQEHDKDDGGQASQAKDKVVGEWRDRNEMRLCSANIHPMKLREVGHKYTKIEFMPN